MNEEIVGISKISKANQLNALRIIIPDKIAKYLDVSIGDSIVWYIAETTDENGTPVKILGVKKAKNLERL